MGVQEKNRLWLVIAIVAVVTMAFIAFAAGTRLD